jgi:pimeloyl-ACP methyl ester carboxylesterase
MTSRRPISIPTPATARPPTRVGTGYLPTVLLTTRPGDRDVILLDQRGVGHSRPALDCAPIEDLASGLACRNQLTAHGADLSAYTTDENAADVGELGPALGYRQVNLFGVSYGTRLALTVMREHPQGIRSVILASPWPPQASVFTDLPGNAARAFQALLGGCAHDPRCAAAYPHLGRDFRTAAARLDAHPQHLMVHIGGTDHTLRLDGRELVGLLYGGIYALGKMAVLPRAIHHAATGATLTDWVQIATDIAAPNPGFSVGMNQSVMCADEAPFVNRRRAQAIDAAHSEQRHAFVQPGWWFGLCARWPTGPVDRAGHTPVHSVIPTLIVTGQYDPPTPPAYGRLAAATLTRSYFTEFPRLAHAPQPLRRVRGGRLPPSATPPTRHLLHPADAASPLGNRVRRTKMRLGQAAKAGGKVSSDPSTPVPIPLRDGREPNTQIRSGCAPSRRSDRRCGTGE